MNFQITANQKKEIITICRRLHERNLIAAADGNISLKISNEEIWITPSGVHKGYIEIEDLACITLNGDIRAGKPSTERLMHLEVYKNAPLAKAVVHAHPPTAIAWSIARPDLKELPSRCVSEVILACGSIPIVPYARPGTAAMGTHLNGFLPDHRVMILSNHGGITWGEDLNEAYNGMERLEHSALILKTAVELGGIKDLPEKEVQDLIELRKKIGPRTL